VFGYAPRFLVLALAWNMIGGKIRFDSEAWHCEVDLETRPDLPERIISVSFHTDAQWPC
jgi:hypothetical protein